MSTIAVTAVALGALAFALLGPVPAYLARARWTAREPRAAGNPPCGGVALQ